MKQCPNCGYQGASNFCPNCGVELEEIVVHEEVKQETFFQAFLKNKKAVKRTVIAVVSIVLAIVLICVIYNKHMENVMIEAIEDHIDDEEYEQAFDKINSGYLSKSNREEYLEIVIPGMQEAFSAARKSDEDNLALIVDGEKYYISESSDTIYTRKNGERDELYEASGLDMDMGHIMFCHLYPDRALYANGCIFFVEEESVSSMSYNSEFEVYKLQCLNLETGDVEIIETCDYYRVMYKLEDGSIFVGYFNSEMRTNGVRHNPYTGRTTKGRNVVTEEELDNAVYKIK